MTHAEDGYKVFDSPLVEKVLPHISLTSGAGLEAYQSFVKGKISFIEITKSKSFKHCLSKIVH